MDIIQDKSKEQSGEERNMWKEPETAEGMHAPHMFARGAFSIQKRSTNGEKMWDREKNIWPLPRLYRV